MKKKNSKQNKRILNPRQIDTFSDYLRDIVNRRISTFYFNGRLQFYKVIQVAIQKRIPDVSMIDNEYRLDNTTLTDFQLTQIDFFAVNNRINRITFHSPRFSNVYFNDALGEGAIQFINSDIDGLRCDSCSFSLLSISGLVKNTGLSNNKIGKLLLYPTNGDNIEINDSIIKKIEAGWSEPTKLSFLNCEINTINVADINGIIINGTAIGRLDSLQNHSSYLSPGSNRTSVIRSAMIDKSHISFSPNIVLVDSKLWNLTSLNSPTLFSGEYNVFQHINIADTNFSNQILRLDNVNPRDRNRRTIGLNSQGNFFMNTSVIIGCYLYMPCVLESVLRKAPIQFVDNSSIFVNETCISNETFFIVCTNQYVIGDVSDSRSVLLPVIVSVSAIIVPTIIAAILFMRARRHAAYRVSLLSASELEEFQKLLIKTDKEECGTLVSNIKIRNDLGVLFNMLPNELIFLILNKLPLKDISSLSMTSHSFNRFIHSLKFRVNQSINNGTIMSYDNLLQMNKSKYETNKIKRKPTYRLIENHEMKFIISCLAAGAMLGLTAAIIIIFTMEGDTSLLATCGGFFTPLTLFGVGYGLQHRHHKHREAINKINVIAAPSLSFKLV